jgi:hypothetical protein
METNFVSLREKESALPLIADYDDNWNGVTFQTTNWSAVSPFGGNFYWHSRLHSIPIFFGMGFSYQLYQTSFSGYSDYNDVFYQDAYGTYDEYNTAQGGNISLATYDEYINSKRPLYQKDFKMTVDHNIYSLTLNVGYKWNTYKTLRPYYMFSAYMSPDIISKVSYAEVGHEGYELLPNFDFETDLSIKLQFRQTLGVEWRQLKFYTAFTSGREELTYSDPEDGSFEYQTALPFHKRFTYTLGMSVRFQKGIAKPVQYGQGANASNVKVHKFKQRSAKYFEFGITGRANTLLSMEGNRLLGDGMSLLQLDRETENISSSTKKESVKVNISEVYSNSMDVRGVATMGTYAKFKTKYVDLEILGNLTPLRINMELEDYSATIYRYVTNNNTGNYIYDPNTFDYNNQNSLEFYYNKWSINPNLVLKMASLANQKNSSEETPLNNLTFYFGVEKSFYQMKSKLNSNGNTNQLQVHQDLHDIYTNGDADLTDKYVRYDQEITYYDDDFLAYGADPEATHDPLTEYKTIADANALCSFGYNFGVGYNWRRLEVRIGGGFAKKWSTGSIYGNYGSFMDISIHYMLFGW